MSTYTNDHIGLDEIEALMIEPPGGPNYGRTGLGYSITPSDIDADDRAIELSPEGMRTAHFLSTRDGGQEWGLVEPHSGDGGDTYSASDAGMTTHRGVLHPDDYVSHAALLGLVEAQLGVTFAEIHDIYSRAGGPLPVALRDRRTEIDAVLLGVATEGGDMTLLANVLGIAERTMDRILARARNAGGLS